MQSQLPIRPVSVMKKGNLDPATANEVRNPPSAPAVAEFSRWMDVELESLEKRFRAYMTRNSFIMSVGR